MARIHIGETFTLTTTVTDRATNLLADADDLTLIWKVGRLGDETIETPTRNSIGNYSVEIEPTESGNLYFRWDTDGAYNVATEGVISVAESVFTV